MHICNVRSQVLFPGVWVCLRFFFLQPWAGAFTVGKHLTLRNPLNMGKFSRNTAGKPGPLRREKESTFDTGRRVETGTYHWEGRKPFIQTFDLTHILFYTQTLLHIKALTHRSFYTQTLLHTDTFTDRHFYTQTLLHTDTFTDRHFYTQTLLHTNTFTRRSFSTQKLLLTGAFTGRRFYNTYQHEMMLWNRSETSWLRSANLSAQHSAEHIPVIWFASRPKTSIKNPGQYQTGARATSEISDCTIMRIVVHSYQDEISSHRVGSHKNM